MRRMLVLLVAAVGLLAAASPASASSWRGVVVAKDAERGTVVTASAGGVVRTARSPNAGKLRIGQRLDVRGSALADGTFDAAAVRANGRARSANVKVVVVGWQKAQKRLLVSAGGSTFALSHKTARMLASSRHTRPGDRIKATVDVTTATPQVTSVSTLGRLGVLEVEGILTKIESASIELIVAKTGFVTLALPTGFALPPGLAQFDAVKAHVAVGTDGKLTLLSIRGDHKMNRHDDDDEDDDDDDDDDEVEVKGTISALSATSISVTRSSSTAPVTCALRAPLTGFAVGDFVEIECVASGAAGALTLEEIEHEDDDDGDHDDDHDDDDHRGRGGGDDH